jgi:hypothetical protein
MKKQSNIGFFPAFLYIKWNHKKMIVLNPYLICILNIFPHIKYLFSNNLINSKIFFPVKNLILSNVFNIFKIVKQRSKNAFVIN